MTVPTDLSRRSDGTGGPDRSPAAPDPARGRGPHGLIWLTLRVHRGSLRAWTAFAAVATAGLLWLYDIVETSARWKGCGESGMPACPAVDERLLFDSFTTVIAYAPFAVAVYAGGVLVARDLENNTADLAWTQSVTPVRWLAARLAVPGLLIMAFTAVMTLIFRLVWTTGKQDVYHPWYLSGVFQATGVTGLAYVILGLAVGALAGVLTRRSLPAMGLSLAAFLVIYRAIDSYRYELWPKTFKTGFEAVRIRGGKPVHADMGLITDSGARVVKLEAPRGFSSTPAPSVPWDSPSCYYPGSPSELRKCLDAHGAKDVFIESHPASHYWPIQLVESGIVLAIAALAAAAALHLLRRRTCAS